MVLTRTTKKPYFVMMIGLAGSGKSTLSQQISIDVNGETKIPNIHSTDQVRFELFGNEDVQDNNEMLYREIHQRIKNDLLNGTDVIYDATNLNRKKRASFLESIQKIPCHKEAICVLTPFKECTMANESRDRVVPYKDMKKMYMNWTPPSLAEGFDHITCAYHYGMFRNHYSIKSLFNRIDKFDQENSHHSLTLGMHCKQAASYVLENYPDDKVLAIATLLHDNGKEFSKTKINSRGIDDGQSHYYQHHCVGAYDAMFYTANMGLDVQDRLRVSQLIYYHMHPYMQWEQSSKALRKDLRIMPNGLYDDIMKLHDADLFAHIPDMEKLHPKIDDILDMDKTNHEIEEFVIER